MNIWLVTIGEPLPIDNNGGDRLYRAGILSTALAKSGHKVVWWTATFDHARKRQRFPEDTTLLLESGVLLKLLHGCGYEGNVSLRRLLDHAIVARKFTKQAMNLALPDVILCSLPPLDLAAAATGFGKRYGIPVVLDVRDLWPDIFLELTPHWARGIFRLGLWPLWKQARSACSGAHAITGNSPHFVEWGLKLAGRAQSPRDRAFFHGYSAAVPQQSDITAARAFWSSHGVHGDKDFVACFFGAIGRQSELDTVIETARALKSEGRSVKFVLCGTGDDLESLRSAASDVPSVVFPGWIDMPKIWSLMRMSKCGLAVYRSSAGYVTNLPNKPIEYFSAGLPVVSSLKGYLETFLADHECGVTYPNGDARALARVIASLDDDRSKLAQMSKNSQRVFNEMFDAEKVYGGMMAYLQEIVSTNATRRHREGQV